jgi:acyl-CoA thioester hydrolase
MARSDFAYSTRIRVRWAEVDAQNIVFNARYLDYADIAVTDYWEAVDVHGGHDGPLDFNVARSTVNYRKPIRPRETIDLFIRVARFGTASMTHAVEIHGADKDDLRAEIELIYVHVDLATGTARPIPEWLKQRFIAFDENAARIDERA